MSSAEPPGRLPAEALRTLAARLLAAAGMAADQAPTVARLLVAADAMGHDTHGLALLPAYLRDLDSGRMRASAEPQVLRDSGPVALWDGHRACGVWLTHAACLAASDKARQFGTGLVTVARAHHTASLQVYLPEIAEAGLLGIIASSDPVSRNVVPHGGTQAVLGTNPIAAGIPGDPPFLLDMATSIVTNGTVARARREDRRLSGPWLVDGDGTPTDGPAAFGAASGGLLPIGGTDHGHKGFGLSLLVEALTNGLSGQGRTATHEGWAASVFVLVIDPASLGGGDAFLREMTALAANCRAASPADPARPVKLPGERAQAMRDRTAAEGVEIGAHTMAGLREWAEKYALPCPF